MSATTPARGDHGEPLTASQAARALVASTTGKVRDGERVRVVAVEVASGGREGAPVAILTAPVQHVAAVDEDHLAPESPGTEVEAARGSAGSAGPDRDSDVRDGAPGSPTVLVVDTAVRHASRSAELGLGLAVLGASTAGRAVAADTRSPLHAPGEDLPAQQLVDALIGLIDVCAAVTGHWIHLAARRVAILTDPMLRVAAVAVGLTVSPIAAATRSWWEPVQLRGTARREAAEREAASTIEVSLPHVMDAVLDRVDLTGSVVTKVDLAEMMTAVLERVDMVEVMTEQLDLERVIRSTFENVDMTGVALEYLDLERIVGATMDEVDLVALMRDRIEDVDVTDVIRSAPATVAGEAVRGMRQTSAEAEKAVSALLGLVTPRRREEP